MPLTSAVTVPVTARGPPARPGAREWRGAALPISQIRKDSYVNCLRDTTRIRGDTKGNVAHELLREAAVLSKEDNEILTRVGPGTPMGNLLRRYWIPACLTSEVDEPDGPPARVRLLGEDLVAFRDTNGDVGLIEERCPHRGASLFYGRNEECGLRCTYHGWKFDVTGQCTDQRSELHPFSQKIKITSYPIHESGGIVWTYMGPAETMTPFRDFGTESLPAGQVAVNKELVRCNWVQSMDGDLDTAHISNLHQFDAIDDVPDDGTDRPGYPSNYMSMKFWRHDPRSLIEVNDEWHGFRYAGIRTTPNGHRHVRVTAWIFPFGDIIAAIPFNTRQIIVVPVDDYNCQRYNFATTPPANPRGLGGPAFYTYEKYPFEMLPPNGVVDREVHAGERLPDRPGRAEGQVLQRDQGLPQPGHDGHRVRRPDLRPDPRAPGQHRRGSDPDAPHADPGGQGARQRRAAAGARRQRRLPQHPRRGEDPRRGRGLAGARH